MAPTALLIQDVQEGILNMCFDQAQKEDYLARVAKTIAAARKANIQIIYIVVGFRRGHPEVSPANASLSRVKAMGGFVEGDALVQIPAAVAPATTDGDVIVTKRRVSAFAGTDLEVVLRSQGVRNLVLAGIATSGVVLSTVRQAADMDYTLGVLRDLCADRDEEVHRVLLDKVLASQAKVESSDDWIASLEG